MNTQKLLQQVISLASILLLLVGCSAPTAAPTPVPPTVLPTPAPTSRPTVVRTDESGVGTLSDEEIATLSSLQQVDDHPLYTMHYYGAYGQSSSSEGVEWLVNASFPNLDLRVLPPAWACSLFAALGDAGNMLYGRNFDWEYSPALLLFTDPPDGYASVSMVDIAYLVAPTTASTLPDLSLVGRRALLNAPFWPFDGMNEHGLAVGMAAVPGSRMPYDLDKETIDSLMVIREMLDHTRNVDEAIALLGSYNIAWQGGPPLHYLIADASGRSVLVEFYEGEMITIPNETSWHAATNHLRTVAPQTGSSGCWRYDKISQRLTGLGGQLTIQDGTDLLSEVSQGSTQWSIVYGMSSGDIYVAMGQKYDSIHTFHLDPAGR